MIDTNIQVAAKVEAYSVVDFYLENEMNAIFSNLEIPSFDLDTVNIKSIDPNTVVSYMRSEGNYDPNAGTFEPNADLAVIQDGEVLWQPHCTSIGFGAERWEPIHEYATGDRIYSKDETGTCLTYVAIKGGLSGGNPPRGDVTLFEETDTLTWRKIDISSMDPKQLNTVDPWEPNKLYSEGDVRTSFGSYWRAITSGLSSGTNFPVKVSANNYVVTGSYVWKRTIPESDFDPIFVTAPTETKVRMETSFEKEALIDTKIPIEIEANTSIKVEAISP